MRTHSLADRELTQVRLTDELTVTTFDTPWSVGEARYLYDEIFTHDDYLGQLPPLRPGSVVIDAGANIGLFSLRVAQSCPNARVFAFEPVPDVCALLRRNLSDAGFADAQVHQVALGARTGSATLTYFRQLPANSTAHPEEKPAEWTASMRALDPDRADEILATEQVKVDVARLSDVWPDGASTIDLLKIDVEGAELDVLHGIDDRHWPTVAHIVAEVQDVGDRLDEVLKLLDRRGFVTDVCQPAMMSPEMGCRIVTARRGTHV